VSSSQWRAADRRSRVGFTIPPPRGRALGEVQLDDVARGRRLIAASHDLKPRTMSPAWPASATPIPSRDARISFAEQSGTGCAVQSTGAADT
jgi:hypothetical protein